MKDVFTFTPEEAEVGCKAIEDIRQRAEYQNPTGVSGLGLELMLARLLGWCDLQHRYLSRNNCTARRILGQPALRFDRLHVIPFPNVSEKLDDWEQLFEIHGFHGDGVMCLEGFSDRADYFLACFASHYSDTFRTGVGCKPGAYVLAWIAALEELRDSGSDLKSAGN